MCKHVPDIHAHTYLRADARTTNARPCCCNESAQPALQHTDLREREWTPMGFEPAREHPVGLAGQHLSISASELLLVHCSRALALRLQTPAHSKHQTRERLIRALGNGRRGRRRRKIGDGSTCSEHGVEERLGTSARMSCRRMCSALLCCAGVCVWWW